MIPKDYLHDQINHLIKCFLNNCADLWFKPIYYILSIWLYKTSLKKSHFQNVLIRPWSPTSHYVAYNWFIQYSRLTFYKLIIIFHIMRGVDSRSPLWCFVYRVLCASSLSVGRLVWAILLIAVDTDRSVYNFKLSHKSDQSRDHRILSKSTSLQSNDLVTLSILSHSFALERCNRGFVIIFGLIIDKALSLVCGCLIASSFESEFVCIISETTLSRLIRDQTIKDSISSVKIYFLEFRIPKARFLICRRAESVLFSRRHSDK